MAFEERLEERRRAIENSETEARLKREQEVEALQIAHDEKRNHPVFLQMRELATSPELMEALLAYYNTFKNREGEPEINMIDTYDSTLKHRDEEPFGLVELIMPISDPYEVSGGDADPVTITDELKVTIRGIRHRTDLETIRIFGVVGRPSDDGSRGRYSSYDWNDILNNIADRIVSKK
jgi:hypothetical protein